MYLSSFVCVYLNLSLIHIVSVMWVHKRDRDLTAVIRAIDPLIAKDKRKMWTLSSNRIAQQYMYSAPENIGNLWTDLGHLLDIVNSPRDYKIMAIFSGT